MFGKLDNPIVKALLQLVPGGVGSALDVFISDGARMLAEERLRTFFEELANGDVLISEELVSSNDFLHCFLAATRAVVRTRRDEKIRLFARALTNGIVAEAMSTVDEFEEAISVIDDLSYREWQALTVFDRLLHEAEPDENPMKRVLSFWPAFVDEVVTTLSVPREEVVDFIHRTARAGVFTRLTGYWDDTGEHGITTPTFLRLRELVADRVG
ncbi:hypothetical protein [Sphingomonas sp. PAMC 26617]|uniref:hypothetical protein n=1 Tax=Sphingomonas sp. PAMC 26617 TaxID=1112216 RepID=UPI0012F4DECD|nr:hypothetical protein [Sphingomonas sp. PAMC 26617]